jgi:hypothetical protein
MSESSSSSNPPNRRRSWLQFGTRTLLVLIVLAALAAWWARGEIAKEQRREEVIALMHGVNWFELDPKAKANWRPRLLAWLRGKPPVPAVTRVAFNRANDPVIMRELVELFPEAPFSLQVDTSNVTPELLEVLSQIKKLDSLHFYSTPFDTSDETLARLAKIHPRSAGLSLISKQVDDDLLRRVASAKVDLGWIHDINAIGDSREWMLVTNEGLRLAAKFPKLTTIIANRRADDEGFAAFKDHPTVSQVELIGPGYTDASAETLASLRRMFTLNLTDTQLTDAGIAKAIEKRSIYSLKLKGANLGEKTIAAIAAMPSLRELELRDVPFSPELAAAIAKHPITSLHLSGEYTDADLIPLAPVAPTLEEIFLNAPHVTDEGLKWLTGAGTLYNLGLNDTQATEATVKLISTRRPHVFLWLGGPNINAEMIAEAHRQFTVVSVSLYGPTIDDCVLAALEPTYNDLRLAGTRTTTAGLKSLKTAEGKKISVVVYAPEDREPPLTQQEIEDIKQATDGLVEVKVNVVSPEAFDLVLPKSSREPTAGASTP